MHSTYTIRLDGLQLYNKEWSMEQVGLFIKVLMHIMREGEIISIGRVDVEREFRVGRTRAQAALGYFEDVGFLLKLPSAGFKTRNRYRVSSRTILSSFSLIYDLSSIKDPKSRLEMEEFLQSDLLAKISFRIPQVAVNKSVKMNLKEDSQNLLFKVPPVG